MVFEDICGFRICNSGKGKMWVVSGVFIDLLGLRKCDRIIVDNH